MPSHPCALLQRDIDIKVTIIEAYEQGKMLAVLSFVRHFLEGAMSSRVFRPPNPWVVGILGLVAEVYNLEGLKTSLKFEVRRGGWGGDCTCRSFAVLIGLVCRELQSQEQLPSPRPLSTQQGPHTQRPPRLTASLRWSCCSRRWACSSAT
jgi:hypothetical protein